jgi:hypothetical protein
MLHRRRFEAQLLGQFLVGRLASERAGQTVRHAAQLGHLAHGQRAQTDGVGLLAQSTVDRLPDPPRSVTAEFAAFERTEPLHRFDQAEIALGDQIRHGQAEMAELPRDAHNQPQVRRDHPVARLLAARLRAERKLRFLLRRQQRNLADLMEVIREHGGGVGKHGTSATKEPALQPPKC